MRLNRRVQVIAVALTLSVLLGGWAWYRGALPIGLWIESLLRFIRTVGPVAFFSAMAILPAFGFPLLAFSLTAGPVFAPRFGLPLVALFVLLSLIANVALTYWLSRYAFRPLLEKMVTRMGYKLPQVAKDDHVSLAVIVRVTPGPPFFVQGYLLGLAEVPFRIYMTVSTLISGSFAVAVVFFGDSLVNGRGKIAFLAFSALVALMVIVQWLRKRYSQKKMVDVV